MRDVEWDGTVLASGSIFPLVREYQDPQAVYGSYIVVMAGGHAMTLPDCAFRLVDRPVDKGGQAMR